MSRSKKDKNKKALKAGLVVHPAVKWVMLIYFCSGVCSLMDEVVWVRLLKLTLGNTAYASCIVVSMFMAGLALGALIMGRYSDQVQRPLRLYVILELCATVSALLLPLALRFADQAYRWFFLAYRPSGTELLLLQVIVSAMILLVPAMVMGSTFPLLGRYVTNLSSMVGRLVGRLYTLNMLGATLGCFLAGFIFIRIAGVMGTVYIAAGINMLVAFSGWILSRSGVHLGRKTIEPPTDDQYGSDIGKEATRTKSYVLMFAFFISGLISIGYELIWMRSIVIPLGGYTYVFSGVLTVYLLGNVIGAGIGSRLSKRLKYAGAGFGVSLSCLGLLGIAYVWWLSIWHFKISSKVISFVFGGNLDTAGVVDIGSPLIYCTFLFLLPAIMMGIGFPLALQAWSNYRHKVGQSTGTVYGINTIGAVIGGIVTGFFLIPLLGIQISITVLGLLGIWLGLLMVQMYWSNIKVATRSVHFLIAAGLTVTAVVQPFDLFTSRIASTPDSETITVLEGVTTTVSVKKDSRGNLILYSDGVAIAGDGDDFHRSAQKVLGNLGVLLHTDANNILSIGFGCGETTASLAQHNPELIDCVEIAPEVVQTALEFFGHINLAENLGQYVNMKYLDGKNYLHLTDNRYDLIINGADIPAYSGSAPLFAKEHFQNASDHLNPGGLFMTKLHLASISKSSFDSILGTFTETYPYVTIWFPTNQPTSFFYLVGSSKKQLFSPEYIDSALQKQGVRESVAYLNLDTSQDVLSCYICDEKDIKRYLETFHLNSDYTPFVEFNIEHRTAGFQSDLFLRFVSLRSQRSVLDHIDWTGMSRQQQEKWQQHYGVVYNASTFVLRAIGQPENTLKLQDIFDGLAIIPEHPVLLDLEDIIFVSAKDTIDKGSGDLVMLNIDNLLKNRPTYGDAWLIKSWALKHGNDKEGSIEAARNALRFVDTSRQRQPEILDILAAAYAATGEFSLAVETAEKAIELATSEGHDELAKQIQKRLTLYRVEISYY